MLNIFFVFVLCWVFMVQGVYSFILSSNHLCSIILPIYDNNNLYINYTYNNNLCMNDNEYLLNQILPQMTKSLMLSNDNQCYREVFELLCLTSLKDVNKNNLICQNKCLLLQSSCNNKQMNIINSYLSNYHFYNHFINCYDQSFYLPTNKTNNTTQNVICTNSTTNEAYINQIIQPPVPMCIPIRDTPNINNSLCKNIIDYDVYIPPSLASIEILFFNIEIKLSAVSSLFAIANKYNGCLQSFARLLCGSLLPMCDTNVLTRTFGSNSALSLPVPFPRYPCNSLCTNTSYLCEDMYNAMNDAIPKFEPIDISTQLFNFINCNTYGTSFPPFTSCEKTYSLPDQLDRPYNLSLVSIINTNTQLYTTCGDIPLKYTPTISTDIQKSLVPITCPAPLVIPDNPLVSDTILNAACALPCPSLIFSPDEWSIISRDFTVSIILSLVFISFMVLTHLIFPVKRLKVSILNFSLSAWILFLFLSIGTLFAPDYDRSKIGCIDNSRFVTQADGGWCPFEGLILVTVPISIVLWWLIITFQLFLKLALNMGSVMGANENKIFIAIGWGFPALIGIIGLSNGVFGRDTLFPWCFISGDKSVAWEWGLFYFPIMVFLILGTTFMIAIIVIVIKSTINTDSYKKKNGTKNNPLWFLKYTRLVLFIICFDITFSLLTAFRTDNYFNNSRYVDSASYYVQCLLTLGSSCLLKTPTSRPMIPFIRITIIYVFAEGIWWVLILGTQKETLVLWYGLLTGRGLNYGKGTTNTSVNSQVNSQQRSLNKSLHSNTNHKIKKQSVNLAKVEDGLILTHKSKIRTSTSTNIPTQTSSNPPQRPKKGSTVNQTTPIHSNMNSPRGSQIILCDVVNHASSQRNSVELMKTPIFMSTSIVSNTGSSAINENNSNLTLSPLSNNNVMNNNRTSIITVPLDHSITDNQIQMDNTKLKGRYNI